MLFIILLVNQALDARHMDSFIANKIPNYLLNTGYNHIQTFNYNVPIGKMYNTTSKKRFILYIRLLGW